MSNTVPEGWSIEPLSALAHYHNGRAFKPHEWSKNGLPIIRIAQINNPLSGTDRYVGTDVSEKNYIRNGDLLFSWSATLTALIWKHGDAVLNQHIFKVEQHPHVDREYLHQLILNSIDRLSDLSHGSTMKHIRKGVLDEFFVEFPPLPEQQKIAAILTSVDNVIESTQAQINKLKDLKTGMMQELLTRGIGHSEFKDSPVGRIPVGWDCIKMNDVVKVVDSLHQTPTFSPTGYPMVRVSDIKVGKINLSKTMKVSLEVFQQFIKNHRPQKGDLLMSRVGSYGICSYIDTNEQLCIGQNTVVIIPESVDSKFLYYCINSFVIQNQVEFEVAGSGYKSLSLASIRNLHLIVPSPEEQARIAQIFWTIDTNIEEHQQKLTAVKLTKKALMQDLLTGKVRVKTD